MNRTLNRFSYLKRNWISNQREISNGTESKKLSHFWYGSGKRVFNPGSNLGITIYDYQEATLEPEGLSNRQSIRVV